LTHPLRCIPFLKKQILKTEAGDDNQASVPSNEDNKGIMDYSDVRYGLWGAIRLKNHFRTFASLKITTMGRIFEVRKSAMFARWDKMAKNFTRIGKEIAIAVKNGGPDPDNNPALRRCYINAKACNMPKDRVEAAIKRAMGKDTTNYDEIVYEGYGPHGVAIMVETATDNSTRTVANVRMHFTKGNGTLGTSGSVAFTFNRMGEFKIKNAGLNIEELELELIDFGLEEIGEDAEGNIIIRTAFNEFGNMSKALEEKGIEVVTAELTRIPVNTVELGEDAGQEVLKLVDKLEQDEDVQKVYHNLK
jgi:YebC/PmpR family DNA-binding regulatory protein